MIVAKWEKGFEGFYKGVDAQKVADEIISIGDSATPQQIVEKARGKGTELHKCFTWENRLAAEKWRTHEARLLVGHLVIQRPEKEADKPEVRYFHKTDAGSGYKPCFTVFTQDDEYTAMLNLAIAELKMFQKKYQILADRPELVALIDAAAKMLEARTYRTAENRTEHSSI